MQTDTITADHLIEAYAAGIFPMAASRDDLTLRWIDPKLRGILPLDRIIVPQRLRKTLRQGRFTVTINVAFEDVMRACAAPRDSADDTWINEPIIRMYTELHGRGRAHSVEVWQDNVMVGGLYGVHLGAAYFGESMFSTARDASKVALVHLLARLKMRGFLLCDTQFLTPHLAQFGGIEIPRAAYHVRLNEALQKDVQFASLADGTTAGNAALVGAFAAGLATGTAD